VGHVVDDAVEAPVQDAVAVGARGRVGVGDQLPDLVVDGGELVDLGVGAALGGDAGDAPSMPPKMAKKSVVPGLAEAGDVPRLRSG
jgi:hypothetical protein